MDHLDPLPFIPTEGRRRMVRTLMVVGLTGPAFLLAFFPQFWLDTFSLASEACPRLIQIALGVIAIVGALLIPSPRFREVGYIVGAAFFGVLTLLGLTSMIFVHPNELIFIFPMVCAFYIEAAMVTVRDKVRISFRKRQ